MAKTYTIRDRLFLLAWLHLLTGRAEKENQIGKALRFKALSLEISRNLGASEPNPLKFPVKPR